MCRSEERRNYYACLLKEGIFSLVWNAARDRNSSLFALATAQYWYTIQVTELLNKLRCILFVKLNLFKLIKCTQIDSSMTIIIIIVTKGLEEWSFLFVTEIFNALLEKLNVLNLLNCSPCQNVIHYYILQRTENTY